MLVRQRDVILLMEKKKSKKLISMMTLTVCFVLTDLLHCLQET